MARITNKTDSKERATIGMPKAVACYWKLKEYEDIEEELGVGLVKLFSEIKKPKVEHFENIYFTYKGKQYMIKELEK